MKKRKNKITKELIRTVFSVLSFTVQIGILLHLFLQVN